LAAREKNIARMGEERESELGEGGKWWRGQLNFGEDLVA